MSPEQVTDISALAIETLLMISGPLMGVALASGLLIALFQALTSIQEMTLTFVPKIILVFIALMFFLPWMSDKVMAFTLEIFGKIASSGAV